MKMKRQARAFVFLPVLALLCCFFAGGAYAQRVAVTLKATDAPLEQVLDAIEKQTTYLFVYDKSVDVTRRVSVDVDNMPLGTVLRYQLCRRELLHRLVPSGCGADRSEVQKPCRRNG